MLSLLFLLQLFKCHRKCRDFRFRGQNVFKTLHFHITSGMPFLLRFLTWGVKEIATVRQIEEKLCAWLSGKMCVFAILVKWPFKLRNWAEYGNHDWMKWPFKFSCRLKYFSKAVYVCVWVCVCVEILKNKSCYNFKSQPWQWSGIIIQLLNHCPLLRNTIKWQGRNPYRSHHPLQWNMAKYDFIRHKRQDNDGGT